METVCICTNISKEEIVSTINDMSLTTVDDVGTFTMAGTCCGKCIPKIESLLKESSK
jgi:NAD(P)H-nitrite reductase large subunit